MAQMPEVPLDDQGSGRLVSVGFAVLMALAVLVVACVSASDNPAEAWRANAERRATVYVPVLPDSTLAKSVEAQTTAVAEGNPLHRILALLEVSPAVSKVRIVPPERVETLLQPWIEPEVMGDLPLPAMIDIILTGDGDASLELGAALAATVPGTRLDAPSAWPAPQRGLVEQMQTFGWAILIGAGVAFVALAIYRVRDCLRRHWETVMLLHILGAPEEYIARPFERDLLVRSIRGTAVGGVIGVGTIIGLGSSGSLPLESLSNDLKLTFFDWMFTLLLPLAAGAVAALAGRSLVRAALRQLP